MSTIANGKSEKLLPSSQVCLSGQKMASALLEPDCLEKHNWLIYLQHVRGEREMCKELIKREIMTSDGRQEYALFTQGIMLREEGDVQAALESFQKCHKLNRDSVDNIKEVARCLYALRRYRLALDAYSQAEKIVHKPDWEIYHNIGQCLLCLNENAKAKEYVKKAVQFGKQEKSYSLLSKILTAEGDLHSASTVCVSALESCPGSVNTLSQLGLLHLKLGQTQQAFENLNAALALDPMCSPALLGLGCITQAHEEYDVALTKYKIAVQITPDSVALWNNIGVCFYLKQKHIAAVSCLKRALWLSPLNWRVLLNLGIVHLSTFQPASAFNFLCAAVNLRSDVGHCFMALGCALFELKDMENASRAFHQAYALSKEDPAIILDVAIVSCHLEKFVESREFLNKFKTLTDHQLQVDKQLLELATRLSNILSTFENSSIAHQEEQANSEENTTTDEKSTTIEQTSQVRHLQTDEV